MQIGNIQFENSIGWPPHGHCFSCHCQRCRPQYFQHDWAETQRQMELLNIRARISEAEKQIAELTERLDAAESRKIEESNE